MKRFKALWRKDRGAALALVGSMLIVLMGMAAFGSDLAWFYLNASRVQRAADAAALGGVIWMPDVSPFTVPFSTAIDVAERNGYDNDADEVTVTPEDVPGEKNQLKVTITTVVPTFFLKVLGFDSMTISRDATAEYIPPLKLGSPTNQFGNSCDPLQPGCTGQSNFWANIHGKLTNTIMGDAYGPACIGSNDNPNCTANINYRDIDPVEREGGYLYGIESPGGFTLQFVDLAFHNTSGMPPFPTGDYIRTGDRGCEDWGPSSSPDCGPTMYVALYAPDPTPLDVSGNTLLCEATIPPAPQVDAAAGYGWLTPDTQGCWSQTGDAGTYVVQVRHVDSGSTVDRAGLNRYSIRATGAQTNLFALGDFSIYNNADISTTEFFLAEVPDYYAGKTLVIELYDPGESSQNGTLQVIAANDLVFAGDCTVFESSGNAPVYGSGSPATPCQELVTPQEYNGRWLKFHVVLPDTYSCDVTASPFGTQSCWWKMNYVYTSSVNDTTTWTAYIIGNPIHLVGG